MGKATTPRDRWNHNIHYHQVIIDALPERTERTLDIGCGEGTLCRELRHHVDHVTGIDAHQPSIDLARQHDSHGIDYVLSDALNHAFAPESFDLVCSIAALHHMDPAAALTRMRHLVRPNGRVVVIGLARSRYPQDLPRDAAAVVATRLHRLTKNHWEHPAPTVWPPAHSHREIRQIAQKVLPGARFRRHLLWRYSLTWTKPAT